MTCFYDILNLGVIYENINDEGGKMKFIEKFQKFMYGRYARPDDLYKFLFWLYFILLIIDLFVNSKILLVLELLVIFIMFYRIFSKNIYKRNDENQKYLRLKRKLLKPFANIKRNIKDKDHVYKKCPKCKTVLKLPVPTKRGIQHAKCPNCKRRVTLFTLKKLKIEIIKNK